MGEFTFDAESIALPTGAWARTQRRMLRWRGRDVVGFTAGAYRPYLFPVYTPAGFPVTAESPADHPHHHSIWAGADHVHLNVPAAEGRVEAYAYNFYVNDVFQGRAPGRIVQTALTAGEYAAAFVIEQTLEWRGPIEWGAPQGRVVLREARTTRVHVHSGIHQIDITSRVTADEHDVDVGPTRHAWFNARVAPSMSVASGGATCDAAGRDPVAAIATARHAANAPARWVDYSGPVGGGHVAGIGFAPLPPARSGPAPLRSPLWWFVTDWGVMTASPCRDTPIAVREGDEPTTLSARFVVHDGPAEPALLHTLLAQTSRTE